MARTSSSTPATVSRKVSIFESKPVEGGVTQYRNELGQPVGFPLADWRGCQPPPRTPMIGLRCRVEPIDPASHAENLHAANMLDREGRIWTYLGYGPFASLQDYRAWLCSECLGDDPMFHAIVDVGSAKALGVASYLRMAPETGVIEVGHINYAPPLQRTAAATEAMYLMMRRVFDELGYRRYEWKCDALNAASRKAAERLGFRFEGIFRQATIYKSRNRDTAWYAIVDGEWAAIKRALEQWLDVANFGPDGRQRVSLSRLMADARRAID